jgi:hypothetical protein
VTDIKQMLESEIDRVLSENGSRWLLIARALEERIDGMESLLNDRIAEHVADAVMLAVDKRFNSYEDKLDRMLKETAPKAVPEVAPEEPKHDRWSAGRAALAAKRAAQKAEVEPVVEVEEKVSPSPNGKHCEYCQRELVGQQKRFCSKSCSNRYRYVQTHFPGASNSEIITIIAGAGERQKSKKYRRYRKFQPST